MSCKLSSTCLSPLPETIGDSLVNHLCINSHYLLYSIVIYWVPAKYFKGLKKTVDNRNQERVFRDNACADLNSEVSQNQMGRGQKCGEHAGPLQDRQSST